MTEAFYVEEIADPDGLEAAVYVAPATSAAFGTLRALVAVGAARDVGERYDENGIKLTAVEVAGNGYRPNAAGSIRIGREFFTGAIKDYEDWQEKWWREAVQNAVDAGATEVACGAVQQDDGSYVVSCEDNGGGMDEDVLLNKFLVLGGTTKVGSSGGTGGFGKAKELLVLPWIAWEIHTRDKLVRGTGIDYEVQSTSHLSGTKLTVIMPADQTTHEAAALSYLGKCNITRTRFTVNGMEAASRLKPADMLREFDGANLYYDKKRPAPFPGLMLIRANGLYMFSRYIPSSVKGQVIIELTKPSIEILTANRDGFRERRLGRQIEDFGNELAADVLTALKKKAGVVREQFRGSGKFTPTVRDDVRAAAYDSLGSLEPLGARMHGGRQYLSGEQISKLMTVLGDVLPRTESDEEGGTGFVASGELAAELLKSVDLAGATAVENAIKQLAWEPDFFVINEVEGFHVPKKFYPRTMTIGLRKLARFWAEMCRFVLMQLGCGNPFGVGFQFDSSAAASYLREDGDWLLLNPYRTIDPTADNAETYDLADWQHIMELYAMAVHEATHMADGISYHDESFAAAMTRNVARTAGKEKQIRAIKRIVTAAEKERRGTRPKRERKASASSVPDRVLTEAQDMADVFERVLDQPVGESLLRYVDDAKVYLYPRWGGPQRGRAKGVMVEYPIVGYGNSREQETWNEREFVAALIEAWQAHDPRERGYQGMQRL